MSKKEDLEKKYKQHDLRTHIYEIPDTYISSVEDTVIKTYVIENEKMIEKEITYVPGLYKIFDEILVNCCDHAVRLFNDIKEGKENIKPLKEIKINIDIETGIISVYNNGNGIDIIKHPIHNIYIPELLFGNLLTSTNYNKDDDKLGIGGKNGLGATLTNIFSKEFTIETVDHIRKKYYKQTFKNNMLEKTEPEISSYTKVPYTKITFLPDYERFGLKKLTDDIFKLFERRSYDCSAVTSKDVSVYFNDKKINIKEFQNYADLFLNENKKEFPRIYEAPNDRWDVLVSLSSDGIFNQISFVNSICTLKGGTHCNYIVNQITKTLVEMASKKKKTIKPQHIKDNLFVFVKCIIPLSSFDSQSKETLTTPISKFESKCELSEKFYEKLYKSGIIEKALSLTEITDVKKSTKTDGKKVNKLIIPKLDDAISAGTKNSSNCTLILTEGDSAKSMAISGLSVIGRDNYGVFPLKGKIMNVKDATIAKIGDNAEITALKKILGLEQNKNYTDVSSLRYGSIMIMTDQDHDGSHIKGLLFNVFQSLWSSLYKIDGFLTSILTPIVKSTNTKTNEVLSFYNMTDYNKWNEIKTGNWKVKYYKGLGTSTDQEAKEYFRNIKKVVYKYDENSDEAIDLAFNKKRADDRKKWLMEYNKDDVLDYDKPDVPYDIFVNKELIHFSNRDLERSINHICDGLKESTRKILYACFKKKLYTNEIKVAQLSGYISEVTAYHHGEASLQQAIIGMAQLYVGTNNINLLVPNGQFGCLAPDTEILMWDTTIKKAKDIKIGDKLVGDDGNIRNVLKTVNGIDEMYEINMCNGEKYKVNSQHILTLKYKANKQIYYKNKGKMWSVEYYDNINNKIITKSINTVESSKKETYNKSNLTKYEAYIKLKDYVDQLKTDDVFDIKIEDLLKLSQYNQKRFYCIKNSKNINWEYKEVPIDPYILGIWLGDGNSNGTGITSADEEILKEYVKYLDTIGCELIHDKNGENHENYHFTVRNINTGFRTSIGDDNHNSEICIGCLSSNKKHSICNWKFKKSENINEELYKGKYVNGTNSNNLNAWKEILKKNNLFNNKHIPNDYIYNSKNIRLELLAGFIDTDGTIKNNKGIPIIEITQSYRLRYHLIKSLELIANSLGFRTKVSIYKKKELTKKGEDKSICSLLIYGNNIDEIPTRLHRKKIIFLKERTFNSYNVGFTIKAIGKGEFYGWSIDNNERFLLSDFTITHNSRIHGGKDSSSPRYIYTLLSKLARLIFKEEDNDILNYLEDDNEKIEPEYYIPIIPMILVNGGMGIGTGFSTNVPQFNPEEIIKICMYISDSIEDKEDYETIIKELELNIIKPYYLGFKGTIDNNEKGNYQSKGIYKWIDDNTIEITELPIGVWTEDYKIYLEELIVKNSLEYFKGFENHYTSKNVKFILNLAPDAKKTYESKIEEDFKLSSTKNLSLNNLHLYSQEGHIKKYENINDIIKEWSLTRIKKYNERKIHQLKIMENDLLYLSNKIRFILDVINNNVQIMNKKITEVSERLVELNYTKKNDEDYGYLLNMPISQLTLEKKLTLEKQAEDLKNKIEELNKLSISNIWKKELEELLKEWLENKLTIENDYLNDSENKKEVQKRKKAKK